MSNNKVFFVKKLKERKKDHMFKSIYNSHFFPRTSQGHNALPQPGLEPGSSDSEPSALTTGLLVKAVALMGPRHI